MPTRSARCLRRILRAAGRRGTSRGACQFSRRSRGCRRAALPWWPSGARSDSRSPARPHRPRRRHRERQSGCCYCDSRRRCRGRSRPSSDRSCRSRPSPNNACRSSRSARSGSNRSSRKSASRFRWPSMRRRAWTPLAEAPCPPRRAGHQTTPPCRSPHRARRLRRRRCSCRAGRRP